MSSDNRFADVAATQTMQGQPPGVYGGTNIVPNVFIKPKGWSNRGTALFSRPDWHRPWRSVKDHQQAVIVTQKEEEIEQHLNRNNDLRVQLSKASVEIQRLVTSHERTVTEMDSGYHEAVRRLEVQLAELKNELERERSRSHFNVDAIKIERDEAIRNLTAQLHSMQANTNDTCVQHIRQLQDVREAAQREVQLNARMYELKTAELNEDLNRTKGQLEAAHKLREATIKEMHVEMTHQQDVYLEQTRESQRRVDALRISYQEELGSIAKERDSLRSQVTRLESERTAALGNVRDAEGRIMDWNTRVLSELDQLYEFYVRSYSEEGLPMTSTVLDDVRRHAAVVLFSPVKRNRGETEIGGESNVEVGRDKTVDSASATVVRILDRLHALNALRSQHQDVINKLLVRIRSLEAQTAESVHVHRNHSEHQDTLISKMHADLALIRSRHDRLQEAVDESRTVHLQAMQNLKENQSRLEFFIQDNHIHDNLVAARGVSTPPSGNVTFVVTGIQGGAAQMEKSASVMRSAMSILNEVVRSQMQVYGGYESKSNGDSMLIAFSNPSHAVQFCLQVQTQLVSPKTKWPAEILNNFDSAVVMDQQGTRTLFRGLRVAMAVHTGDVCLDEAGCYFGPAVTHTVALAAHTCGGQILISGSTWQRVRDEIPMMGNPNVVDLQEHRLPPSDEYLRVVQVLPYDLRDRGFTSLLERKTMGVVHGASEFLRLSTSAQVEMCKAMHTRLDVNLTTVYGEANSLQDMIKTVGTKLREMQINTRTYAAADIFTHVAMLDRVSSRLDSIFAEIHRSKEGQNNLTTAVNVLEENFAAHHRTAMSDEEFRRRVALVQERSQESLHEQKLAHEHQTQQLRNQVHRMEQTIADMRAQIANGTVEALQLQLTKERSRHEQLTKDFKSEISNLNVSLTRERMLTRFQHVPRVAEINNALQQTGASEKENTQHGPGDTQGGTALSPVRSSSSSKRKGAGSTRSRVTLPARGSGVAVAKKAQKTSI